MHIDKPADQPVATAVFRPRRALSGRFSFGLSFECRPGTAGTAAVTWCGARGVVVLNGLRWHARSLRLPAHIGTADRFALQVQANVWLKISLSFHSQDASEEDFEIETGADPAAAPTECADGTGCEDSAPGEDTLAAGYLPVPAKRRQPLFLVRAVRPCGEAAVMSLALRRPAGAAAARQVLVRVTAGDATAAGHHPGRPSRKQRQLPFASLRGPGRLAGHDRGGKRRGMVGRGPPRLRRSRAAGVLVGRSVGNQRAATADSSFFPHD